ncbi:MAG TPA: hypothetical protein PKE64_26925 [Anaerolineae bacterium]|nr:hypothetical protein [Anaerolineae bacterium]HMR67660.1 hypothetical protein [Anaerolineae bacterium]
MDITRDVMRSLQAGKDLQEIRADLDADYSRYGPPTETQPLE